MCKYLLKELEARDKRNEEEEDATGKCRRYNHHCYYYWLLEREVGGQVVIY